MAEDRYERSATLARAGRSLKVIEKVLSFILHGGPAWIRTTGLILSGLRSDRQRYWPQVEKPDVAGSPRGSQNAIRQD